MRLELKTIVGLDSSVLSPSSKLIVISEVGPTYYIDFQENQFRMWTSALGNVICVELEKSSEPEVMSNLCDNAKRRSAGILSVAQYSTTCISVEACGDEQ